MSPSRPPHPFPILLWVEWFLLGVACLAEFLPSPLQQQWRFPLLSMLGIGAMGGLGMVLPLGRSRLTKLFYTLMNLAVLWWMGLALSVGGLRLFPLLYLVLMIRGCLLFALPGRIVLTGVIFCSFLFNLIYRLRTAELPVRIPLRPLIRNQERIRDAVVTLGINSAFLFGLVLVFSVLLINAVLAERESREKLAIANQQLRQYALRVEDQATLQERNRISREIHDSLGHVLTALNIQLEGAVKLAEVNPAQAKQFLTEAKRLGSTALQEVRQSVSTLRSDPLQRQSLASAIATLIDNFQRTTSIPVTSQIDLITPLPPDVNTTVYRIVQESLTNICKYAHASTVSITIRQTATGLQVDIRDNGQGFAVQQTTSGFGLQGMRERTLAVGGQFQINSAPGQGCWVAATFPAVTLIGNQGMGEQG